MSHMSKCQIISENIKSNLLQYIHTLETKEIKSVFDTKMDLEQTVGSHNLNYDNSSH